MFRDRALYFINNLGERVNQNLELQNGARSVYQELLKALEAARTRLAIAIAEETKATPLERWNYYLETSDQMRRCLKRLRALPRMDVGDQPDWLEALETLRQVPPRLDLKSRQGEANQLCKSLRAVLMRLSGIADQDSEIGD
jgi:hypothetical protein